MEQEPQRHTQKSISRWEQVGRKPGYAFPSYDKMVGLAKCLQVDVPYLTGDMGGRTYDEQYIADSIGTDPGVVALIKELEQYASEKIDYEDDGDSSSWILSKQRCADNIPIRISMHSSPKKAWNANAMRNCNFNKTRRNYERKYGRNCLSKEGPIPTKTR